MIILPDPYYFNPEDPVGLALNFVIPLSVIFFTAGATYRILKLVAAYFNKRWIAARGWEGISTLILGFINVYIYPPLFALLRERKGFIVGLGLVHLIGLIPLIFLLAQHVALFSYLIPYYSILWPLAIPLSTATATTPLTGLPVKVPSHYGSIWGPLTVVLNGDVLTLLVLVALGFKLAEKAVEYIKYGHRLSDIIVYIHLILIVLTGALAAHHSTLLGEGVFGYRLTLGLHMTLAGLFLALIPFTKYWHFVFGMYFGKLVEWVDRTWMRGAALEGGRLVSLRRRKRGRR